MTVIFKLRNENGMIHYHKVGCSDLLTDNELAAWADSFFAYTNWDVESFAKIY